MPVSKPMKLMTLLIDEDEKRVLQRLAREQNVTLSHALREGARMYLAEWREGRRNGDQEHDADQLVLS